MKLTMKQRIMLRRIRKEKDCKSKTYNPNVVAVKKSEKQLIKIEIEESCRPMMACNLQAYASVA